MRELIAIFSLLVLGACGSLEESSPKFVVEGFIFAGEPIGDIRIKEQIDLNEVDSVERFITDAQVVLLKENVAYPLSHVEGSYHYIGDDLSVEAGDHFRLEATVGGRTAYAETTVPEPTSGLAISSNQLVVPPIMLSFGVLQQLQQLFFTARITASWDNPNDELHFIVVEPVVSEIDSIFPTGFPQEGIDFLSSFKFAPQAIEVDTFSIVGIAFESYGRHSAKVYRVNQEYADLFNNPEQDSRDLSVPPSNVVNGFGIFSAFAADSIFFDIVRE